MAENGKRAVLPYIDNGNAYDLPAAHERFAQLMASGRHTQLAAHCLAFDRDYPSETGSRYYATCCELASRLAHTTSVVLRIQELKRPVVRKIRAKLNYTLQQALEQCEVARALAYEQGDAKTLLKAVELQAKLAKLLSEDINVNHRYGLLDDASTSTLLAMRKDIEVRHLKEKKLQELQGTVIDVNPSTPQGPPGE